MKTPIDNYLINDFTLSEPVKFVRLNEVDENNLIVPDLLLHHQLLQRVHSSESKALDYYFSLCQYLVTDENKNDIIGVIRRGRKELLPFSVNISGAYHLRIDLIRKLGHAMHSTQRLRMNGKAVEFLEDLIPYFNDYAAGFKQGFDDFEETQINPFLSSRDGRKEYDEYLFSWLTTSGRMQKGWLQPRGTFTTRGTLENRGRENEIVEGYRDGLDCGHFYRAWCVVFSRLNSFSQLFNELFQQTFCCKSKELVTDIEELCYDCPLRLRIAEKVEYQIGSQVRINQKSHTESQIEEYIRSEIVSAEKEIEKAFIYNMQDEEAGIKDYTYKHSEHIIWNTERIKVLNKYLTSMSNNYQSSTLQPGEVNNDSAKSSKIEHDGSFQSLFKEQEDYESVIQLLINQKFIDKESRIWVDTNKGNKALLAAVIKHLHTKGYYTENRRPSLNLIHAICMHSFGWEVSIDTIKKANPAKFDLSFIPHKRDD
ncbi:MAG TPA: hypothetical protein P5248_00150 [Bacteroidales bacterium]|nr:hypothetical protein [Bacteroidales bacterium]